MKPENIIVRRQDLTVKLIDFGFSHFTYHGEKEVSDEKEREDVITHTHTHTHREGERGREREREREREGEREREADVSACCIRC
jgi:hypothetical protein